MSNLKDRIAGLSPKKRELLLRRLQQKDAIPSNRIPCQNRDSSEFPLSFAQQRLWFLHQLDPNSPAYKIPAAIRLKGHLDRLGLEWSLNQITQRHELLRTTFDLKQGLANNFPLPIPISTPSGSRFTS